MTTRTVTVTTEEEEEVHICDHCGLSDDAGDLNTYRSSQRKGHLHYHDHCVDEITGMSEEVTIRDLAKDAADDAGYRVNLILALGMFDVVLLVLSGVALYLGSISGFPGYIMGIVLALCLGGFAILRGWMTAVNTAHEVFYG